MQSERNLLVRPGSFLEMSPAPPMSSRSDSINSVARRGNNFIRRTSNSGYASRNPNKNKRSFNGDSSSECGQHLENSYADRQFRGGYLPGWDSTRNRGKVFDNNKRYPTHQNKVKRNFNAPIASVIGNMPQNHDIECKSYICPSCKFPYNYFKNRNTLLGRLPRVLVCGHTTCEDCINKSFKTANSINCSICFEVTMNKNQNLDYNYFVIGHILCSKMNSIIAVDNSDVSLISTGVNLREEAADEVRISKNFESKCGLGGCLKQGTFRCFDCNEVYCEDCDEALHTSGKHLLSHRRDCIENVTYELKKCPDHLMFEDLHCVNCEENCCCYCMLEKHEGHSRIYLIRLNEDEEKQLKISYKVASKRLQELLECQNKLKKPEEDKVYDVEIEIARCFTDLHAQLSRIEKKLRLKAKNENSRNGTLQKINDIIQSNIDTIKYLMMCCDRRSEIKLNLRGLLQKLKEIEKIPTVLIDDASGVTEPRLIVNENVYQLESHFQLEIPTKQLYKLVSADELPENNENMVPLQQYDLKKVKNYEKPPQNEASTSSAKIIKPEKIKDSHKIEFEQQAVYITHMHSLNCFYVQFKKEDKQFKELMKEIKSHMENGPENVIEVDINELYLTPCLTNKKEWGRVRALEEVNIGGDKQYKVKFIDFGNEKVVDKSELKHISSSLANRKPFAVQCKLDNLSQVPWTKNSHLKLANLLGVNQEVIMLAKEFSNNVYTVDLNIITSCGDIRSLSDLLIYGYDALQTDSESLEFIAQSKQLFNNSDTFVTGESYEVYMRCIVDPWNIYIQRACYQNSLSGLLSSMETFYHMSKCDIHVPFKGSDVVIFYPSEEYGDWHRARIVKVFNNKKTVDVFLVDWGKRVNVPWQNLRNLVELFRTTECLVVKVKLADVHPQVGDWSHFHTSAGKKFFEKYSKKNKSLKMLVSAIVPIEVVLFENCQTYDKNINALFVEQGFGYSTGKLSETVNWPHKTKEEKDDENEYLPIYKNLIDDEDDSEEEPKEAKTPVEIVRFEDPHSIYVTFVLMNKEATQLHEELQIYHVEKYDVQKTWNVKDRIVVFDPTEKEYCRARIEMIKQDMYYVYLVDRGDRICVTKKELRRMSPYFATKFPNMVVKCHLANIKPAGDSTKWSFMSIEWFQKLLEKHKEIYMMKVSSDERKLSMPVKMWYSKVQQGTALEPSIRKFFSIEKKLVKAGLAFYINEQSLKDDTTVSTTALKKSCSTILEPENVVEDKNCNTIPCSENIPENPSLSEKSTESQFEDDNIKCEINEWQPNSIKKKEFYGYITCAENEGFLFVRDEELQPIYKEMEHNMKQHFDSIPKANPFVLHEHQLVTVWHCDFWYRGVILSVINKTSAKIMMVDFGSDHIVNVDHLHNKIMYPEIPVLVSKIKLYNIYSRSTTWSNKDVDILLNTISEYSRIVIRSILNIEIPLADVYDKDGVCLNDKIVELCPNLYRKKFDVAKVEKYELSSDNNSDFAKTINSINKNSLQSITWSSMVEDELEEMRRKIKKYNYVRLPYSLPGEKILMDIISILDYRTVSVYIGSDESKEEFALLSKSLQEEAPYLESLVDWEIGMPCISLYDDDDLWYRAKILQIDQLSCGYVTVIYVDYGNFEIVKATELKSVKQEWLNFPATFFDAKLNYQVVESKNESYLLKHIRQLQSKSKLVEIVSEEPLTIHIYNEEDGQLYYDMFVKNDVIRLDVL
ncbi:hypothetical protein WA026_004459 [Henosepilachna vigintioctopunctata]|uniref:Tudor domain-containing protein 1 n=1 Tax=Henosepilachna vigintioctopunctata TaxID=420089 RepID=A0AAW1V0J2_9CUCU